MLASLLGCDSSGTQLEIWLFTKVPPPGQNLNSNLSPLNLVAAKKSLLSSLASKLLFRTRPINSKEFVCHHWALSLSFLSLYITPDPSFSLLGIPEFQPLYPHIIRLLLSAWSLFPHAMM